MPNCVICNCTLSKGSLNTKDKYELAGGGYICKNCAQKIGINSFMSAGFTNAKKVKEKYFKLYPDEAPKQSNELTAEDQERLDNEFVDRINAIPDCKILLVNELKHLRNVLNDGEEVIHAINGVMGKNSALTHASSRYINATWLAALTNTRIILIHKHLATGVDCFSFPLETVKSVSYRVGLANSTVTITQGLSCVILENIKKGYETPFVDKANDAIRKALDGNSKQPVQKVTPSGADELMKWHSLLQQGIITQEEFDTQKAKLLR